MTDEIAHRKWHGRFARVSGILLLLCSCAKQTVQSSNYHEIEVKDGGSISGTVTFAGARPTISPIVIEKDEDACGTHHPNASDPGTGSGIAGAVVYIDTIASGKPFAGMNPHVTLDQKGCEFLPHLQLIKNGTSIIVSNSDKVIHNAHFMLGDRSVLNEVEPEGAPPHEVTLPMAGLYMVRCDIHPWMRGFIVAADHPYYAVTDSAGHYTLANVPPGHYTLKLWRDNWAIDQPRINGHVSDYNWGSDFRNQKQIDVQANAATTVNFTIP